jgi:hypothetical protein
LGVFVKYRLTIPDVPNGATFLGVIDTDSAEAHHGTVFNHFESFMTTCCPTPLRRVLPALLLAVASALPAAARAHHNNSASELSTLSLMPVALSVTVPMVAMSVGGFYVLKAVELSAQGTVWVLERSSDGVRLSVTVASEAAAGVSLAAGATVTALACSAGWVLHSAGKAIAIVPNAVGQALIYNERVTR